MPTVKVLLSSFKYDLQRDTEGKMLLGEVIIASFIRTFQLIFLVAASALCMPIWPIFSALNKCILLVHTTEWLEIKANEHFYAQYHHIEFCEGIHDELEELLGNVCHSEQWR